MHKGFPGAFHAHTFVQSPRHRIEIYQRHSLPTCHFAHGIGIIAVRGAYASVFVKTAPCGRSDQDGIQTGLTATVDEYLQVGGKIIIRSFAGAFLLLVVMAEFKENPVARFGRRQYFFKRLLAKNDSALSPLSA